MPSRGEAGVSMKCLLLVMAGLEVFLDGVARAHCSYGRTGWWTVFRAQAICSYRVAAEAASPFSPSLTVAGCEPFWGFAGAGQPVAAPGRRAAAGERPITSSMLPVRTRRVAFPW